MASKPQASIHKSKQPKRPHFIPEWAEHRGLEQKDLVKELGADKGVVSRWFNGTTPGEEWQIRLADFFQIERDALFRHPNDDWMSRFLRGRPAEEVERIKQTLEAAFPRRKNSSAA